MDYRLTDRYLEEEAKSYSMPERRVFLPDCFWCYDPLTSEPEPDPSPALAAGHITFGCLNNFSKLNDATLRLCANLERRCRIAADPHGARGIGQGTHT